jgi:membrane protein
MAALPESKRAATKALVPTTPAQSTVSLVRDALTETVDVVQAPFELAALEVREDAKAAARVAAGFAVGTALALFALAFFGAAAAFALALVLPAWAACLIVAAAIAIGAAFAFAFAKRQIANHDFTPERTIEALQEQIRPRSGE